MSSYFRLSALCVVLLVLFSSCSSTKQLSRRGVARIKAYTFAHGDIPKAFDGFRIAFISDLHYKSTLQEAGLSKLIKQLQLLHADVLLMGGDYKEGVENIAPLFQALSKVKPTYGIIGVLGNNDYEVGYDELLREAKRNDIVLLENRCDTLLKEGERIVIAGVRNPFDLRTNGESPDRLLSDSDFVVLLSHTPDYAQDVDIRKSDLVLAGHTHGGQVTLFGLYAPKTASHYGQHFRSGLRYTIQKKPVIITNGIGTSQKPIRMFAPSEIVLVTLRRLFD
jgi:predicted MPP superfamily phosphohydrolase